MRRGRWFNGTTRGFLILAAIAGVIVVFQLYQTLVVFLILARIAFFLAIAYFVFLLWRERRQGISMWPQRARSGPARRIDARIFRQSPGSSFVAWIVFA